MGTDVWRRRAWRAYLWPGLAFALGVLMWPVMTFFTNSAIHMVAHGAWAQVMMGGAAGARARQREAAQRLWRLGMPAGFLVSGIAFLVHEQNAWFFQRSAFLHHLLGWTLVVASIFPLVRVFRPRSQLAATGFALVFVVVAVTLYCDRDLAPIFGHLSPLAGAAAPMRRRCSSASWRCSSFRRRRSRMRRCARRSLVPRAVERSATDGRAALRPVRQGAAAIGSAVLGDAPLAREANLGRRSCRQGGAALAAQRARTPSAGTRSRPTGTSSRASGRSASARRAAADGGVRRVRPDAQRARRALGVLPRARAADRRPRVSLPRAARPALPPRGRVALLQAHRPRRRRRARGRHRRVPAARGGCAAAAVRRLLYGDLSPIAGARVRHGVHRDDARLRARRGAALPRVAARAARSCSGPRSCSRSCSPRGSRCRVTRPPTRARRGSPSSRTGCISPRRACGSAGSCSSARRLAARARRCGARRSSRYARLAPVLVALLVAAGST